jgi:hypothetical protein
MLQPESEPFSGAYELCFVGSGEDEEVGRGKWACCRQEAVVVISDGEGTESRTSSLIPISQKTQKTFWG